MHGETWEEDGRGRNSDVGLRLVLINRPKIFEIL